MGVMIEHFAGNFPLWLSPVQAVVIPVSEKFDDYAAQVLAALDGAGLRAQADRSSDGLGKKIRNAEQSHIPYMLVVGEKEALDDTVSVRSRKSKEQLPLALETFVAQAHNEMVTRAL